MVLKYFLVKVLLLEFEKYEIINLKTKDTIIFQITADPPDINILPEYGNDPRVVTNLIDGVNKTRDDIHMWLAPFKSNRNHFIYITFEHPVDIAMIRIWVEIFSI